jgi:hypothetical protein
MPTASGGHPRHRSGHPPQQADNLTHAVTDSARAAIEGLAAQPRTQFVADAARDAMTHSVTLAGSIAADVIVLGLIALDTADQQHRIARYEEAVECRRCTVN